MLKDEASIRIKNSMFFSLFFSHQYFLSSVENSEKLSQRSDTVAHEKAHIESQEVESSED